MAVVSSAAKALGLTIGTIGGGAEITALVAAICIGVSVALGGYFVTGTALPPAMQALQSVSIIRGAFAALICNEYAQQEYAGCTDEPWQRRGRCLLQDMSLRGSRAPCSRRVCPTRRGSAGDVFPPGIPGTLPTFGRSYCDVTAGSDSEQRSYLLGSVNLSKHSYLCGDSHVPNQQICKVCYHGVSTESLNNADPNASM